MNLNEIGQRTRDRREELGLSQARLAKLVGLSRVTINQLETGAIGDLGVSKLLNLLNVLGCKGAERNEKNICLSVCLYKSFDNFSRVRT